MTPHLAGRCGTAVHGVIQHHAPNPVAARCSNAVRVVSLANRGLDMPYDPEDQKADSHTTLAEKHWYVKQVISLSRHQNSCRHCSNTLPTRCTVPEVQTVLSKAGEHPYSPALQSSPVHVQQTHPRSRHHAASGAQGSTCSSSSSRSEEAGLKVVGGLSLTVQAVTAHQPVSATAARRANQQLQPAHQGLYA